MSLLLFAVSSPAFAGPGTATVIIASQAGCAVNSNIDTGGGTDDTACLQNAINTLAAGGGGTLILDGVALISNVLVNFPTVTTALVLKSGVWIKSLAGAGVYLKDHSNVTMIGNDISSTATTATNIGIIGGVWNGNRLNQSRMEENSTADQHTWVFGMWFGGYNGLTIQDLTIRNSETFALTLSHGTNATITNYKVVCDAPVPLPSFGSADGIHMWGPLDGIYVDGMTSNGDDDTLALNTSEAATAGNVRRGLDPNDGFIQNATFKNVQFLNASGGIRLGSAEHGSGNHLNNIVFQNISGTILGQNMQWDASTAGIITIDGWDVTGMSGIVIGNSTHLTLNRIRPGTAVAATSDAYSGDYYNSASSPVIYSFSATPNSIVPGQSTTLAWTVSGGTSISIDHGVGDVTNLSSKSVSPGATTTYTLTVVNPSGTDTAKATVTIAASIALAPTVVSTYNSATVTWTTTLPADSLVEYGRTSNYTNSSPIDPALVTNHMRTLTGLLPGTLYHFRADSHDAFFNLAVSSDLTFTTQSSPLSTPTLNLPAFLPINATITVQVPPGFQADHFVWTFTPVATGSSQSAAGLAAPGAPASTLSTKSSSVSISQAALTPGTYIITVQAADALTPPTLSAAASATVTLVLADLSSVRVYPNPWRSDKHAAHAVINFSGLTNGTTIKIFTTSGHQVKELHTDNPSVQWDLTNDGSEKVASGVYLYMMTDGAGDKVKGKVGIIK